MNIKFMKYTSLIAFLLVISILLYNIGLLILK